MNPVQIISTRTYFNLKKKKEQKIFINIILKLNYLDGSFYMEDALYCDIL